MRVDRERLLNALMLTSPGLSDRDVIEQSGSFVFQDGRVITFNDEITCSCPSRLKIEGAIPAKNLSSILSKLKEEHLDIVDRKKEILIKGKSNRRTGVLKEAQVLMPLGKLEKPKKWYPLPDDFAEGVEFVQECAGRDEAKFSLTCIHVHPKFVEAFDNYKFARFNLKMNIPVEFLVRQQSLRQIVSRAMTHISVGKNWVHFKNSDKLMISCRLWKDEFLDLSSFVKAGGEPVTLPKSMIDGADRAEVFSADNTKEGEIKVDLSRGMVELRGEGPFGWYREKKKIEYNGPTFSFMIPPKMLMQILKQENRCLINERTLKVVGGKKATFLTSLTPALTKKKGKTK